LGLESEAALRDVMKLVAYFIRHGETDLNKSDEFRGDLDVPLNAEGQKQAEDLVPYFKGRVFSDAFASSRIRTDQTLAPLLKSRNMEATILPGLDSLDTGDFAGLPKNEENKKKLEWYREHPDEQIPGGDKVQDWRNKVDPLLLNIIKKGEEGPAPVVAGTHGSILRELSRLLHNDYNRAKVDPGGVIGVFKSPYGYTLKALLKENDKEEDIKPGS
jgi:broad specificity phosphatase PhoE